MSNYSKEHTVCDIVCKSHSARSERELYRICPSKLSKRELEDLYFALLENNLQLKRAVNEQREQIKVLSTKVHRMTAAQKGCSGKDQKDCCANSKAVVSEQRELIADLKKANERMSERLRVLNMRLCSAKQFLRPAARPAAPNTTTTATTAPTTPNMSLKNSSTSALNMKESELNVTTISVSCQYLDKGAPSAVSTGTGTDELDKPEPEQRCQQNKCRSALEELKQKILDLQEEVRRGRAGRGAEAAAHARAGERNQYLRRERGRAGARSSALVRARPRSPGPHRPINHAS